MSKSEKHAFLLLGAVVLGVWMLGNPRCGRGCRTLAEHLISHGVDQLLL